MDAVDRQVKKMIGNAAWFAYAGRMVDENDGRTCSGCGGDGCPACNGTGLNEETTSV